MNLCVFVLWFLYCSSSIILLMINDKYSCEYYQLGSFIHSLRDSESRLSRLAYLYRSIK